MRELKFSIGEKYLRILLTDYVRFSAKNVKSIRYIWIQVWKILIKLQY